MTPEQLDKIDEIIIEDNRKCITTLCESFNTKYYLHVRLHPPKDAWIVGFCAECAKKYKAKHFTQELLTEQDEFYLKITGKWEFLCSK